MAPTALERREECILVVLETCKRVNRVSAAVLEIKRIERRLEAMVAE